MLIMLQAPKTLIQLLDRQGLCQPRDYQDK